MSNSSNKRQRIGIDARLWNETGVGRYIRNLVCELQKIDKVNEYVLFVLSKDKKAIEQALRLYSGKTDESSILRQSSGQVANNNWSIVPADISWHGVREQLEFPKILEKEHLHLMHFPYFSVPLRYKGKYVLTIHDLILHHFPTGKASTKSSIVYWIKHIAYKFIISQAAKKAEKIITVSHATKEEIVKHLGISEESIVVTYEGVDERIKNSIRQVFDREVQTESTQGKKGLRIHSDTKYEIQNTKYFLYVGNAYPHKNLDLLVEAYLKIRQEIPEVTLVLVGKEDFFYKRLKEKVKKLGLHNNVLFLQNISDEDLGFLYTHALALVMPSLMEGFGLPLLEALNMSCLVAASGIPAFTEIAGDIPLYFSPTDVNQLADVLESIAKGRIQDAQKRKEKGKILTKNFSWENMARETKKVYQSCLGI